MAAECLAALHLCRIRATRLDSVGNPEAGPNNVYVSDKPIQIQLAPQIEAGRESTLIGGCDCIIAQYKGIDKLKYWTLQLDLGVIEPALKAMLIGGDEILNVSNEPIGLWYPSDQTFDCSNAQQNIAFEAWQDLWEEDHQAATPHRYLHHIWPSTYWQIGPATLGNDFYQPQLNGFTRGNSVWGDGIFGDTPDGETVGSGGGYFYSDEIPDAECGFQSFAIT